MFELKEKLANYDYIKVYAQQYTPHMIVGLGLGADLYINDAAYKTVADANFQMFTTGNAMKHSSVVTNNGNLNFETIDAFMNLVPSDIKVYGHNFIWHTQQKQTYLKSLIAFGFQAFLIMICIGIYAVLIQEIAASDNLSASIWGCMGYTVLLCFTLFKTGSMPKSLFGAHVSV